MTGNPDDITKMVTQIPTGSEANDGDAADEPLTVTGESTIVADVRGESEAVLPFGVLDFPEGKGPGVEVHSEPVQPKVVVDANLEVDNDEKPVLLNPEFIHAIEQEFGRYVDEATKFEVFLVIGGYQVKVTQRGIQVSSSFELGSSENYAPEAEPSPESLIKELERAIQLRDALLHFEYVLLRRGLAYDGYYEHIMGKGIVFDSTETVLQELHELKEALEEIADPSSENDSDLPPASDEG